MIINLDSRADESKESLGEYFSETSEFWEVVYQDDPRVSIFYRLQMKSRRDSAIEYILQRRDGGKIKVLDIGSGPGTMMDKRLQHHCEIVLLDISSEMIRKARSKMDHIPNLIATYLQGDVTALPFGNGYFDVVTGLGLIEYIKDEDAAVDEIKRVLKPNGRAILSFPNALKIGNIVDPFFVFFRIPQYLWSKVVKRIKPVGTRDDLYSLNRYFSNRRYLLTRLRSKMCDRGLAVESYASIGFGPFTVWRREFLPEGLSIYIYQWMEKASRKPFGSWLHYLSNRWVFCFKKIS